MLRMRHDFFGSTEIMLLINKEYNYKTHVWTQIGSKKIF